MLPQGTPDPQRGGRGPLHLGELLGGHTVPPRLRGDRPQRLGGRVVGQQVEQAPEMGSGGGERFRHGVQRS